MFHLKHVHILVQSLSLSTFCHLLKEYHLARVLIKPCNHKRFSKFPWVIVISPGTCGYPQLTIITLFSCALICTLLKRKEHQDYLKVVFFPSPPLEKGKRWGNLTPCQGAAAPWIPALLNF